MSTSELTEHDFEIEPTAEVRVYRDDELLVSVLCDSVEDAADAVLAWSEVEGIEVEVELAKEDAESWPSFTPGALADHIVATHHEYLWRELPALEALAGKVRDLQYARHVELQDVVQLVRTIRADMEQHLFKEERILFPAIHTLEDGVREFAFGSVANPIRMMTVEHDRAGELLARLRKITSGFTAPEGASAEHRLLYARLAALDTDTSLHIHKEEDVLFPAASALEGGRA